MGTSLSPYFVRPLPPTKLPTTNCSVVNPRIWSPQFPKSWEFQFQVAGGKKTTNKNTFVFCFLPQKRSGAQFLLNPQSFFCFGWSFVLENQAAGVLVPKAPIFSGKVIRLIASATRTSIDKVTLQKGNCEKGILRHGFINSGWSLGGGSGAPEHFTSKIEMAQLPPQLWEVFALHLDSQCVETFGLSTFSLSPQ